MIVHIAGAQAAWPPHACRVCAGPLLRVSKIAVRGTEDFSSPELLTGIKLYEECESLEELDGHTRDVVAADAWSVGAILFNAATGMTRALTKLHPWCRQQADFSASRQVEE